MKNPAITRTTVRSRLWRLAVPLALHVIPTLVIGYGVVIPSSIIAGVNELTIGFGLTVIGFIPSYVAGLRLAWAMARHEDA